MKFIFLLLMISINLFSCRLISFREQNVFCTPDASTSYFTGEAISFNFSCEVNKYMAEKSVSLKEGEQQTDIVFTWSGKTLFVKPKNSWINGQIYQAKIDGLIYDKNNSNFSVYKICTFIYGNKDDYFCITEYPSDKKDIETDYDLVFKFNKSISMTEIINAFSISPKTEFSIEAKDLNKTFLVKPKSKWLLNSTYTWKINSFTSDNWKLKDAKCGSFSTKSDYIFPSVTELCPVTDSWISGTSLNDNIRGTQNIGITFSKDMDILSVKNAFSISPYVQGYIIPFKESKKHFLFIPEEPFKNKSEYTISISTSAKDTNGISLREKYRENFVTRKGDIHILGIYLDEKRENILEKNFINHKFFENADKIYEVSVHFEFSTAISDKDIQNITNAISMNLLFPLTSSNPVKTGIIWSQDKKRLTITWNKFSISSKDILSYYQLKINSIKTEDLSFSLEDEICINIISI